MTSGSFAKLADVHLLHEYDHADSGEYLGALPTFRVRPTQQTRERMRGLHLLFREHATGFALYFEQAAGAELEACISLDTRECLCFFLEAVDVDWRGYTDLPLDRVSPEVALSRVLMLTNAYGTTQRVEDGTEALLTTETFLSESDEVQRCDAAFELQFQTSVRAPHLHDAWGESQLLSTRPVNRIALPLSGRAPGPYSVRDASGAVVARLMYDPELRGARPTALLCLLLGAGVPDSHALADGRGKPTPKTFYARMAARRTFWRYFVCVKYRSDLSPAALTLTAGSGGPTFERQNPIPRFGLATVVPFVSSQAQAFKRKSMSGLRLRAQGGPKPLDLNNLPTPQPRALSTDEQRTYADVMLYV